MNYTVYILHSETLDKFYIGYTKDLEERLFQHLNPVDGAKYTAKVSDWNVFYETTCVSQKQAMQIERHLKRMKSSIYLRNLIKYPEIMDRLKTKY